MWCFRLRKCTVTTPSLSGLPGRVTVSSRYAFTRISSCAREMLWGKLTLVAIWLVLCVISCYKMDVCFEDRGSSYMNRRSNFAHFRLSWNWNLWSTKFWFSCGRLGARKYGAWKSRKVELRSHTSNVSNRLLWHASRCLYTLYRDLITCKSWKSWIQTFLPLLERGI